MALSLAQSSSWVYPHHITKTKHSLKHPLSFSTNPKFSSPKPIKICSLGRPSDDSSTPSSSDGPEIIEKPVPDRVKLALERAREYKKSLKLNDSQESKQDPVGKLDEFVSVDNANEDEQKNGIVGKNITSMENRGGDDVEEVPEAVRIAMEKAREYKKNKENVGNQSSDVESEVSPENGDSGKKEVPEAVRIAMDKAKEYKKDKGKVGDNGSNDGGEQLPGDVVGGKEEIPEAVRIAMEKAKEYKKKKGTIDDDGKNAENSKLAGRGGSEGSSSIGSIDTNTGKKDELKISSTDFVGLNFSDKKQGRGLPAGLVPVSDPFPEGDLPEVEFLVGDTSKFGNAAPSESKTSSEEESSDLYKPKVTTWGMFPRPSNISKTFGGGRTIRPGQALETPEDKAAKQARTRELLAAYKRKIGLNIDPKLKEECEKALKDGDSLMDVGRLKEALPYYQKVIDKLAFQTELHGLAALQWSICQDSLNRPEKARVMYEKLQTHPTAQVNKKARQFMFSFQAMEMMKVTRSNVSSRNTGYQKYFEAFVEDKDNYASDGTEAEEGSFTQALPYLVFLASPILLVLLVAASKGT